MSGRRLLALAQRLRALNVRGPTATATASSATAPAPASAASAPAAAAASSASAAPARSSLLLHHQRRLAWTDAKGYTHFGERTPLAVVGFGPAGGGGGGAGGPHSKIMAAAAAAAASSFGLYWWSCRETVPFTGRRHSVMFVSPEMEASMGRQTFAQIRRDAAARGALLPDQHPAARLVARVGARVAAAAEASGAGPEGGSAAHMRGLAWEYAVVDDPQINAMVAPGGKVVVYTGLLRLVQGNEDELAAVLAHEAAHVLARHHAERLGRANFAALANVLARWLLGVPVPGAVVALALVLPHSRANEREADAVGVRLAARACFDPAANVRMLRRLAAAEGGGESGGGGGGGGGGSGGASGGGLALLRTHPLTGERVEAVKKLLPAALAEYEARCGGGARAVLAEWGGFVGAAAPGPLG